MANKKQYALVTCKTAYGKSCLNDIQGLKEMDVVSGKLSNDGKAFEFKYNKLDAVLWVDENCIIIKPDYNTVIYKNKVISVSVALVDSEGDMVDEFDTVKEARQFMKKICGQYDIKFFAAEWINADGDLNFAAEGNTRAEAIAKLKEDL